MRTAIFLSGILIADAIDTENKISTDKIAKTLLFFLLIFILMDVCDFFAGLFK